MKKIVGVVFIAVVGVAIYAVLQLLPTYNDMVAKDEAVSQQWANIDAILQERYAVLPSLTAAMKSSQAQEKDIFLPMADAHSGYASATGRAEQIAASYKAEQAISGMRGFFARYPNLQSQGNISRLMTHLSGLESKIAQQRIGYNEAVATFNTIARTIPGATVSFFTSMEKAAYYRPPAAARVNPGVDLGGGNATSNSRDNALMNEAATRNEAGTRDAPRQGDKVPASDNGASASASADGLKDPAALRFRGVVGVEDSHKAVIELPDGRSKVVEVGDVVLGYDGVLSVVNAEGAVFKTSDGRQVRLKSN